MLQRKLTREPSLVSLPDPKRAERTDLTGREQVKVSNERPKLSRVVTPTGDLGKENVMSSNNIRRDKPILAEKKREDVKLPEG